MPCRYQYRIQVPSFGWSDWRPLFGQRTRSSTIGAGSSGDLRAGSPDGIDGLGAGAGAGSSTSVSSSGAEILLYDSGRQAFTVLAATSVKEAGGLEMVFHVSTWILNCTAQVLAYSQPVVRGRHDMSYAAGVFPSPLGVLLASRL